MFGEIKDAKYAWYETRNRTKAAAYFPPKAAITSMIVCDICGNPHHEKFGIITIHLFSMLVLSPVFSTGVGRSSAP